jgi:glyoxylase-like metal-dependent hydrolase (beta-lactamase superfamily II)/ferredoxin
MADLQKIVPENVAGKFFVDLTCIDCDTCRQLAPNSFKDAGEHSFVYHQPQNEEEARAATQALLACPTGSIGTQGHNDAKEVMADFPMQLEEDVFYCGFNSAKSYGANSYFIQSKNGNWLIDSPKYLPHLVKNFAQRGGLKCIFLTHQDDVADAKRYASEFGAQTIIHRSDMQAEPNSEEIIDGKDAINFAPDFEIIPVPGHTKGHMVLLYKERYLFTGDHLAYDPHEKKLIAYRSHCWYSWKEQTASMERLLDLLEKSLCTWILPGHGSRICLEPDVLLKELSKLIVRMKKDNS